MENSAPSDQYFSRERISLFPWQPIGIFNFRFREVFLDPPAQFGARRSGNVRVDSAQTNNVTLLKL